MLEPGPVETPARSKANDWCQENVDLTSTDPKTKSLMDLTFKNFNSECIKAMQSCEEVAQIVQELILGQRKDLRVQTNDKFGPDEVTAKLADPTGNASLAIIAKRYLTQ